LAIGARKLHQNDGYYTLPGSVAESLPMTFFDRSVHSAAKGCLAKVYLHAIFDDLDVPPKSAVAAIELFAAKFAAVSVVRIVSITGRISAMDRDNRRDRVKSACGLIAESLAGFHADAANQAPLASSVVLYDSPPAMQAISGIIKPGEMTGGSLIVAA
jgi:hypothetical protein